MMVLKESRVLMDQDHRAQQVRTAHKALWVLLEHRVYKELLELKAQQVLKVQ
jgi:hypothetical protein